MINIYFVSILKYRISASVDNIYLFLETLAELFEADLPVIVHIKLQHPLIYLM